VKRLFEACAGARGPETFFQAGRGRRCALGLACLLTGWSAAAFAQNQAAPRTGRPLSLNQTRYQLRAGERTRIDAAPETLDFLRSAKGRSITINGSQARGFAVAPGMSGNDIILAASLTLKAGDYAATLSALDSSGEERTVTADITVEALPVVPPGGTTPPVVLLNGWQFSVLPPSTCPIAPNGSVATFGSLASQLVAPQVYFFDNCVEQSVNGSSIEELGVTLGQFLNMIQYAGGALVPQVDLVSHSMGGLIVRAYLSGLQGNGSLSPVLNPRVRKFIEIATPNFGSFLAATYSDLLANGTQAAEMVPGSSSLWSLGTWNQHGDDLRGVDALAIIGNAGYWKSDIFATTQLNNASDGVVSLTSASLNFARDPSRTRILQYCHIGPESAAYAFIDCTGKGGIANVDDAPQTGEIILSFLANTTAWQSVGFSNQTQYGGAYFALENAAGTQYTSFSSVTWDTVPFESGWLNTIFYNEFISGSGTFAATSTANQTTTCGPFTATGGYFSVFRCKFNPLIYSVGPLLSNVAGEVVASGGNITISGVGFGQQCSACQVTAYPGPVALKVSSWSDAAIVASLPSTFNGIAEVIVQASAGSDSMTFMSSPPPAPPAISLSSTHLQFAYTLGGAAPAAQSVTIANSGGGTLSWSASSGAPWLTVSPATGTGSGTLTLGINTSGLGAQTYNGSITVTAAGATNSPQAISVTLTVSAAPPSISLSASKASFAYTLGGSAPASQTVTVANAGGGTLTWSAISSSSWLTVSPGSGVGSGTLTLGINVASLTVQTYNGTITVTAAGAADSPQTISVTLTVNAAASAVVVTGVANSASWAGGAIAPGELLTIAGSMLGPSTGVSGGVDPSTGKMATQLAGTSVTFNGVAAPLLYVSATQVNAVVPYEAAGCAQATLQVQFQGTSSAGMSLPCASAAPGLFTFNASGIGQAAAANQDGTFNGASVPAAKGTYVTLYFTGGGQTNPPGVTGSITGTSTLKWLTQAASVTVGGVAATVAFDGAAPAFVDGVLQLNIQVSGDTPSGSALPVVVTIGNVSSPATATLAVQ
jgi:uncharacterized protein (TIGR03437 family)